MKNAHLLGCKLRFFIQFLIQPCLNSVRFRTLYHTLNNYKFYPYKELAVTQKHTFFSKSIIITLLILGGVTVISLVSLTSNSFNSRPNSSTQSLACEKQLSTETCSKIGQMLIVGFGGLKQDDNGKILWQDPDGTVFNKKSMIAKDIKFNRIGGVILFLREFRQNKTGNFIRYRNIQNPDQLSTLTSALKNYSDQTRKEDKLEELELIISIDQEGGMVDRLPKELGFQPENIIPQAFGANEEKTLAVGSKMTSTASTISSTTMSTMTPMTSNGIRNPTLDQTYQYANQMAAQLNNLHFNINFAPCVDVNINPLNPVLGGRGRCFSSNYQIVIDQAWEFIQAFHNAGIIATLKHFPGHGSSLGDTHEGLVDVTDTYHKMDELEPYRELINRGYEDLIMTTHVINGQIDRTQCKPGPMEDRTTWCPGTMSYATLTSLLREQLGFKGVIVSDDMTMGAIANEYPLEIALEKAINAGVDMFILANYTSHQTSEVINTIARLVIEGKVQQSRIDDAYNNIVKLKKSMNNRQRLVHETEQLQ